MLKSTLNDLCCARCTTPFETSALRSNQETGQEVYSGSISCGSCEAEYPILAGVAVLVEDVHDYLMNHVKGISKIVPDAEIPSDSLAEFLEAKSELQAEHIEEDLEAERVNALYLMNHYLRVQGGLQADWWKPRASEGSSLIGELVTKYWDHGPFEWIAKRTAEIASSHGGHGGIPRAVELGCGVGGLAAVISPHVGSYLGVDSAFASIALARHLILGAPYRGGLRIPEDLLAGGVSREIQLKSPILDQGKADFVVGDFTRPPLVEGNWDLTLSLNAIDMMDEPGELPELQQRLLKSGGHVVSSCPYIWHEEVARRLRAKLPGGIRDSAQAAEWLYREAGFEIRERQEQLPWLFFKHVRQLEVYSVHLFTGQKPL